MEHHHFLLHYILSGLFFCQAVSLLDLIISLIKFIICLLLFSLILILNINLLYIFIYNIYTKKRKREKERLLLITLSTRTFYQNKYQKHNLRIYFIIIT